MNTVKILKIINPDRFAFKIPIGICTLVVLTSLSTANAELLDFGSEEKKPEEKQNSKQEESQDPKDSDTSQQSSAKDKPESKSKTTSEPASSKSKDQQKNNAKSNSNTASKKANNAPTNKSKENQKSKYSEFDKNSPIEYSGLGGIGNYNKKYFEINKDFNVVQADFKLNSDKAQLYSNDETGEMEKLIATGNVEIEKIDPDTGKKVKAYGEVMTYYVNEARLVIEGNAKVIRGDENINSNKITYFLETGDMEVDNFKGVVVPDE